MVCFKWLYSKKRKREWESFWTFRAEPDLEFEGLLKRQHTRVKYFQGSLMNAMDLERSKVIRILQGRSPSDLATNSSDQQTTNTLQLTK